MENSKWDNGKLIKYGYRFMLLLIFTNITFSLILGQAAVSSGRVDVVISPLALILNELCLFGIPVLFVYNFSKSMDKSYVFNFKNFNLKNVFYIVLMTILISPTMMLLSGIASLSFDNVAMSLIEPLRDQPFLYMLAAIAIAPALFEELAFRGVINSYFRNLSIKKAALINGLLFGIIHLNLQQFLYAFAVGVILTLFVRSVGSIWASMLSHFVINGSQLLLSYTSLASDDLAAQEITALNLTVSPELMTVLIMIIPAALCFALFVIVYKRFVAFNKTRQPILADVNETEQQENATQQKNVPVLTWELILILVIFTLFAAIMLLVG